MKLTKTEIKKAVEWLFSDDIGESSKDLCRILIGHRRLQPRHPIDPSDFGSCYRFMEHVVPAEKRKELLLAASKESIQWKAISDNWEELEKLWLSERKQLSAPKLWDLMKKLGL